MNEDLIKLVLACLQESGAGEALGRGEVLNAKTKLYGSSGLLDSTGLVGLIVELEQRISETYGRDLVLADEKAMSRTTSPFRNVETLASYAAELLAQGA